MVVVGGINILILIVASLIAAVQWSINTFSNHPLTVIAAWSGTMTVICLIVLVVMIWLSREKEEEENEDVE